MNADLIKEINKRLEHAKKKHPEGPSLEALYDEVMEVENATSIENKHYELVDVITVAVRLLEELAEDDPDDGIDLIAMDIKADNIERMRGLK